MCLSQSRSIQEIILSIPAQSSWKMSKFCWREDRYKYVLHQGTICVLGFSLRPDSCLDVTSEPSPGWLVSLFLLFSFSFPQSVCIWTKQLLCMTFISFGHTLIPCLIVCCLHWSQNHNMLLLFRNIGKDLVTAEGGLRIVCVGSVSPIWGKWSTWKNIWHFIYKQNVSWAIHIFSYYTKVWKSWELLKHGFLEGIKDNLGRPVSWMHSNLIQIGFSLPIMWLENPSRHLWMCSAWKSLRWSSWVWVWPRGRRTSAQKSPDITFPGERKEWLAYE